MAKDLPDFQGFDWNLGNRDKNKKKHEVSDGESEEIFFNSPLIVSDDPKHSLTEVRYVAFGKTNAGRNLTVVFTRRENLIRVISARDMNKREKEAYKIHEKTT